MSTAKERLLARATLKQTKENTIAVPNKNVLDQRQNAAAQARQKAYQSAYKTAQTVAQNRAAAQKTGAPVLGAKTGTFWYNDQNTPNFDPATAGDAIEQLTKPKTIVVGAGRGEGRTTTREIQVPTLAGRINAMTTGALENSAGGMLSAAGTVVSGLSALNGGQNQTVKKFGQGLNRAADAANEDATKQTNFAKENTNAAGKFLVDVGTAGTQMLADAGTAAMTGGSALVPMFLRSFGGGAQEARQDGKGVGTQLVYGLGEGAIQAGTEKISNVGSAFSKMFGKGVTDDVLKGFINKATTSATGRAFMTAGASAAGEGFEEFVGDILEPILKRATGVDSTARFNLGAAAYDAAIGAALGGVGAASDISAGIQQGRVDRADNAINNAYDAMKQNGMFSQEARDAAEQAREKFVGLKKLYQKVPASVIGTQDAAEPRPINAGQNTNTENFKGLEQPPKAPETEVTKNIEAPRLETTDELARNNTAKTVIESAKNGTKPAETVIEPQKSGTGENAEAQTWDIAPKVDSGINQERENTGYMDALADDRNAPKAQQGNRPTMARKDLRTDVLNLFSVPAGSRKALGEAIDRAGAEMLRTGGVTEENRAKLMDALYDAGVTVRDADPAYKAVRDDLRGRKIYVDESTRADLGDDWRGLAGRALGNGFSLTTDAQKGTPVDRIMQEMAGKFGEGMFDESTDSSTALRQLIDIAEAGKPEHISLQEEAENLGRQYGEGAVEDHADNLRRQMDAALQRFAEKAGLEIKLKNRSDAAIEKEKEHWKELLQRSSDRGRERLENQKTYYQDMMQRKKERHERSVAATQTQKSLRYLRRRLGYHDTKLAEALDSLSAEDRETAEYALQNIADNAKSLTAAANEKLKANAKRYEALVKYDENYIPSKETLEELERMDRAYLADLSVEELARKHRVIQSLRTHLADMDREIGKEHGRQIETIYQQSKAEIQGSKGRNPGSKARRKMTDFLDSQLTPMNRLKQLGGWKDGAFYSMAKQLEEGERARKEFEVKANRLLKDFREKNADWIAKSDGQGKNGTWYELEVPALLEWGEGDKPIFGDTVKVSLTPAMRVELARGVRNYDNLRHAEGGVTFPNRTLYSKGDRAEAYARGTTIKLAPETMKKLFSYENLTPQEQELYRLGDQFFNKMAKDAINKTSQELDGVDRALSQYYSKIYTNSSYRPTDVTTVDQSLGGMGSLQKRIESKAPMLAVSMWEAYADTIDTVGKYSGLSIPVRNMNMLYNWMESGQNESLKSVLEDKWGTGSTKFMGNLLKNLQNKQVLDKSGVDALAEDLLKNYITATFGANPGIVLKQATSFPSGAAVLGWDTIPTPKQMSKVDTELIAKYTPELEYRSMGYATPELAELKNNPNWTQRNKFTRFVFGGAIQAMDRATVKCMWPWAENAVRKNYSDLEPGTDAFYKKTAELFNKAVSETQPMYDVMHRAEIMQNPSSLTRTFTMFKTVPLQQQNMIRRAVGEAQAANTPEEVSKARGQVASTAASLVVATLGYEGVEFLNQLLKNAAKGYRDDKDDDKLTAKSVLTTLAEKSVKDLAGMTIGGKDLADVLMKSFGDVDYYETDTPGLSQMMDLKTAADQIMETFKTVQSDTKDLEENGGSLKQYVKENGNDLLGDVKDEATLLAELSKGVPVPNIEKYLLGTLQWTSPELKEEYEALWDSTNKRDLTGLSGKALQVRVGKLMDLRVDNLSDEAKDELARLYESVGTEVIPSDVPSTIHMDDEDASLTRTMQQTYQNAYGGVLKDNLEKLLSSKSYQSMTDQAKSAAVTDLYDYAKAVAANKTVGKEMTGGAQKAAGVIADGGELPDYLHFCATVGDRSAEERLEYLSNTNYSEDSKAAIYLNALASDSKQKAWAELKQQGITKEKFYQYALAVNGQTAKADLLRAMDGLNLPDDKKATVYFAAEATDSEKEKLAAAEKEGVSEQVYFQYLTASAGMSKKAQKLVAINGLDLTVNQKNALYYANGWAKSTLYDAPWYDIMPRLSSGGEGSRRTSGQSSGTSSGKTGTALDKYGLGKYSLDKYDIMPKL